MRTYLWVACSVLWVSVLGLRIIVPPPAGTTQAGLAYAAYSFTKTDHPGYLAQITESGYDVFWLPFLVTAGNARLFGLREWLIPVLGWMTATLAVAGTLKIMKISPLKPMVALVLVLNPWLNYLSLYHLPEMMTLAAGIFWLAEKETFKKTGWWILAVFSSPTGLIAGAAGGLYYLFKLLRIKEFRKAGLWTGIMALAAVFLSVTNPGFVSRTFEPTILKDLNTNLLAAQINEKQKILFLGSGRTFILPAYARKIIFNKAITGLDIAVRKAVSLADFEQWTAPTAAWAVTGLSGLPPRGAHPALLYFWEPALILLGLAVIKRDRRIKILIFTLLALLPAIIFEKRYFHLSALFLIPLLTLAAATGLGSMGRKGLVLGAAIYILSAFLILKPMYLNPGSYTRSDILLYRSISSWVESNGPKYDKVVITDRFGPTGLMYAYYSGADPDLYWAGGGTTWDNLEFRELDLGSEMGGVSGKTAYAGLPGEITGKRAEYNPGQSSYKVLKTIETDEVLVYGFGPGIWIWEN
ncbi:hypothetical protein A2701_03805 [Candidatus Amesbacteria bacterium RIFCSPHIGHO2_01_FULL_47_34]|uniref:Glycosyltransferase RgtA/B/C/D-like domain-containing protein n=1 Tax=Candidatus Amesbacteria bacterium RIFCSPLOWO2_01_FULL_47_33 TaxID=1797258 RepID=A0A1F4Z073_9BACT|nr:MAG: hypothetical protein A2972_04655 [Candidatus Amesbacteria bacterium RIFCSPLOWO2_01_FULL_47_33]OGD00470.1 MAG: hypothetical protein A2701_03805 [Candidatus Amesbacteria bacterium RIFCSPHIGHO2_01_FULL_47_34]